MGANLRAHRVAANGDERAIAMTSSKYTSISNTHLPTNTPTDPAPVREAPQGQALPSTEHHAPITELMTAVINLDTDAYVRIYDGEVAPLGGIFVVERKELVGKTPEEIQAHFSLTFVPRMICDARIPVGAKVAFGKLTNAAGKRVSIFRAISALNLSAQRPLTPENIAPMSVPERARVQEPAKPVQPPLPEPLDIATGFNISNAEQYLRSYFRKDAAPVRIPDEIKMIGPDRFPYVAAQLDQEPKVGDVASQGVDDQLRKSLVQSLLNDGFGLSVMRVKSEKPVWVYRYSDLLCLSIFGSLRPYGEYDPNAYPSTIDAPPPPGTATRQGRPSDELLPAYARRVIADRIAAEVGRPIPHEFYVFEYPEVDTLRRLKLVVPGLREMTKEQRRAISEAAQWCVPYALYTASTP